MLPGKPGVGRRVRAPGSRVSPVGSPLGAGEAEAGDPLSLPSPDSARLLFPTWPCPLPACPAPSQHNPKQSQHHPRISQQSLSHSPSTVPTLPAQSRHSPKLSQHYPRMSQHYPSCLRTVQACPRMSQHCSNCSRTVSGYPSTVPALFDHSPGLSQHSHSSSAGIHLPPMRPPGCLRATVAPRVSAGRHETEGLGECTPP